MPRRRRSAMERESASGMRRMCLSNPSAALSPAAFLTCSANTGPYSIQWPSPSMTGWVSPERTFSGCHSLRALMLSPPCMRSAHCAAILNGVPATISRCGTSDAEAEAAAEEIEHITGAPVGEGVADVVRRPFIDPHLDIPDLPAERLVIRGRADRLGAGHDDQRRALYAAQLIAPAVARHQQDELADIGRIVLGGLVEKPLDEPRIDLVQREAIHARFGEKTAHAFCLALRDTAR